MMFIENSHRTAGRILARYPSDHFDTVCEVAERSASLIESRVNRHRNEHDISERIEKLDAPSVVFDSDESKRIKQHNCLFPSLSTKPIVLGAKALERHVAHQGAAIVQERFRSPDPARVGLLGLFRS
jgi:hypothetical protein